MSIRKSIVLTAAAALTLTSGAALAAYPEKPIKIMVGFSAGGGTDTTSRGFASYMHEANRWVDSLPILLTFPALLVRKRQNKF